MSSATANIKNQVSLKSEILVILMIFLISFQTLAQNKDTSKVSMTTADTSKIKKHSPRKAAIMSACIPGLGQVYNKKYWKIPIIYAGAAAITYFVNLNSKNYNTYRKAYAYRTDGDTSTVDNFVNRYGDGDLLILRDYYRRDLELTYIIGAAVYALNIIDAAVDAHLYKFDINNNLSMKVCPLFFASGNTSVKGLTLLFTFNNSKRSQRFFKY